MIELLTMGSFHALQHTALITLVCWCIMVVAVTIDLWTGIDKAKTRGERIHSRVLRRTVVKIGEYWRVLVMFLLFDIVASFIAAYDLPYGTMVGAVCILVIELRSVFENLSAKRSAASQIPDTLARIVQCKDVDQARQIMGELLKNLPNKEKN